MIIKKFHSGPLAVNTYVSHDETKHGFIVDPGGYAERITEYIAEEGIILDYIIITHGHCDHIGGVDEFRNKYPDSKVVAAIDEKDFLLDADKNSSIMFFGHPLTVKADIYVADEEEIVLGNTTLKFLSTPGHSPGGMCIVASEGDNKVCYSGDTLFKLSVGRTDLYGGDMDVLADSIMSKLYTLPDETIVLPGHMSSTTIGEEKRYNPFVQDSGKQF
ncbi:MAG: MBL fold metallo-hydrolase [Firmicutes bacterium]|nr:MBL fold metallo-hydrolase [Bacillota bacterium]